MSLESELVISLNVAVSWHINFVQSDFTKKDLDILGESIKTPGDLHNPAL